MADYRTLFDDKWLRAWDLGGKERTVTIDKVVAGVLEDPRKKTKDRKPIVFFKGVKKPLAFNKTNARIVAAMFGKMTEDWVGKAVTLYPTTTQVGADPNVDCIRVKPGTPKAKPEPIPDREPPVEVPDESEAA